jgi:hypothetical protein
MVQHTCKAVGLGLMLGFFKEIDVSDRGPDKLGEQFYGNDIFFGEFRSVGLVGKVQGPDNSALADQRGNNTVLGFVVLTERSLQIIYFGFIFGTHGVYDYQLFAPDGRDHHRGRILIERNDVVYQVRMIVLSEMQNVA